MEFVQENIQEQLLPEAIINTSEFISINIFLMARA